MCDKLIEAYPNACAALSSMIARSVKAQAKFAPGTAQHTLQKNRIHALTVALQLTERAMTGCPDALPWTKPQLEAAVAPLASLTGKSEKAQTKLAPDSWQYAMLASNLAALRLAAPLLHQAMEQAAEGDA